MSVTKKDLAKNISKKLRLSQKDSLFIRDKFIAFFYKNEAPVNIHNFGTFKYKITPERLGRNPKTRKEYVIKSRRKRIFMPSEIVKKQIN